MNYSIKDLSSLKELQDFFKENYHLIIQKEKCFMNAIVSEWDEGILSDKLVSFSEGKMAQQIDAINPNQSMYKICNEIYTIMLGEASKSTSSTQSDNDSLKDFSYEDWKFNQFWREPDF